MPARMAPPAPAAATPSPRVAVLRWLALGTALALVALGVAWESWLAPTGRGSLALKVLPLVLALPGLWRHRMLTYRRLSLLVWLYVLEGLVRGTSERAPAAGLAWAEVALALALFGAVTFYIRRRLADGAAATRADTA
ncbi:MAG: DUF2069 domain-containing protein [Burkholderiales bacterium]|nr:DUF2069 domain-containing protein [Burkholderiales bacterium]